MEVLKDSIGCIERLPINGTIVGEIVREPNKIELVFIFAGSQEEFAIDKKLFESKFILRNG